MTKHHILCCDGNNLLHRARSGFTLGAAPVAFNFFRSFRALIERFEPSRVYLVMDGAPRKRLELFKDYKANRAVDANDTQKLKDLSEFHRQKAEVVGLMQQFFPVSVMQHPDYEADDLIHSLIKRSSSIVPWTVISTDTDFIQLLDTFNNVKLWNPVKKEYINKHPVDYVKWKALRGDGSDNIPGLPGIGDKTAEKLLSDDTALGAYFHDNNEKLIKETNLSPYLQYTLNLELVKFIDIDDESIKTMNSSAPKCDWDAVKAQFSEWKFNSITNDKSWNTFVGTFDRLWGE